MEAVFAAAALAALVWCAAFAVRGSLVLGCLAYLLAAACLGYPLVHFDLGPLPITIDRLALALLLAAYVVQRGLRRTDPKPFTPADAAALALVAYLAASTVVHDWRITRDDQVSPIWRLAGGYIFPLVIYWIARQSPLSERQVRWAQAALFVFGIYLGATGIFEIAGQWSLVVPRYIADPEVGLHFGRARGPMVHSVTYGHYLAVALLAGWLLLPKAPRAVQLAMVAVAPVLLAGLFFCYTRSVWIGTGAGLAVVLALTLRGAWRPLVLGGMLAAAMLVAVVKFDGIVEIQREGEASDAKLSAVMRGGFAYVSWRMFLDRPIFGVGFGQFVEAKKPYLADRSTELNLEVLRPASHHNHWLSILTETGLVGLVLYALMLGLWAHAAWRLACSPAPSWARRQGILLLGAIAVYACQSLFHELSYSSLDHALLFFLAGMTTGLSQVARSAAAEPAAHVDGRDRTAEEPVAVGV